MVHHVWHLSASSFRAYSLEAPYTILKETIDISIKTNKLGSVFLLLRDQTLAKGNSQYMTSVFLLPMVSGEPQYF